VCVVPLGRGRETRAAVQVGLVAAARVPRLGVRRELAVDGASLRVGLEPVAQPRPVAKERLVRDLGEPVADGDEPRVGERLEHSLVAQLPERDSAPHGCVRALVGKPEQEPSRRVALVVVEPRVRLLGEPCDCTFDTTRRAVGLVPEHAAASEPPQLEQRCREQRQGAGLPLDLGNERVDERRLDLEPGERGRRLDRAAELVRLHRPDQHLAPAHELGEAAVLGAAAVEVGAEADDDARVRRRGDERVEEAGRFASEHLLELIHRDHARDRVDRLAGSEELLPPAFAPRQRAAAQGRQEAGAEQRRLAAARRTHDRDKPSRRKLRDELGDGPLAPEEELRVVAVVRSESLERADAGVARRRRRAGALQLVVLVQDRPLEPLQRSARLETELLPQQLARLPVSLERLGLSARAVERKHELAAQAFLQRVGGSERLELRDELIGAAERELGVDAIHPRGEPQLLEAPDLGLRELEQREFLQRQAAPELQRRRECRGRGFGLAGRELPAALVSKPLEANAVEFVRPGMEQVAAGPRLENAVGEAAPEPRDRYLESVRRISGPVAEKLLENPLARHDLVRAEEQQSEERVLTLAAEPHPAPVAGDLEWPENPELDRRHVVDYPMAAGSLSAFGQVGASAGGDAFVRRCSPATSSTRSSASSRPLGPRSAPTVPGSPPLRSCRS
jgi:hypothetical protein